MELLIVYAHPLKWNWFQIDLYGQMTKRTSRITVRIIDDLTIEINNLTTGEIMEYEKVSD